MINDKKIRIVVPMHPGKDIKPGLSRAIIREAGITRERFLKLLKEKQKTRVEIALVPRHSKKPTEITKNCLR